MTRGDLQKSYVSAFGLDFPEIREQVADIYNEQQFLNILVRTGAKEVTKQYTYKTVYSEKLFQQGDTTGATVTGSGTAIVTTTTTAGTSGFARKNDQVEFATSGKIGIVQSCTSGGAETMVIKSVDGTNITHVAGEKLIFFGTAVGEKSDTIDNIKYGVTSKINKIQGVREKSEITNVESASVKFVTFNGQAKWIAYDHIQKRMRLERMLDAIFFKSEMSATSVEDTSPVLVDPVGGGAVQTTRGWNKALENDGGIITAVATPGTYTQTDHDALMDTWNAARLDSNITALGSDPALRKFSTWQKGLNSSGVTSAKLEVNGQEFNWNCEKGTWGRFTVSYTRLPLLDDPDMSGGTLSAKCIYYAPMGAKVKTVDGNMVPMMRTRYIKNTRPYGNDMVGEIHSGALNPINPTGTKDEMVTEYITEQGFELLGPQLCTRQRVTA